MFKVLDTIQKRTLSTIAELLKKNMENSCEIVDELCLILMYEIMKTFLNNIN